MSTNQQLRDGIKGVAEMLEVFPLGSQKRNCAYELRRLLELPADDSADTERLEWLMKELSNPPIGFVVPMTRASIDAAMHPAPTYRPWTEGEAMGKRVVVDGVTTEITVTNPLAASVSNGHGTWASWDWLFANAKQPDGSPCGVEVH